MAKQRPLCLSPTITLLTQAFMMMVNFNGQGNTPVNLQLYNNAVNKLWEIINA